MAKRKNKKLGNVITISGLLTPKNCFERGRKKVAVVGTMLGLGLGAFQGIRMGRVSIIGTVLTGGVGFLGGSLIGHWTAKRSC